MLILTAAPAEKVVEVVAPMVALMAMMALIGWIVHVVTEGRRRRERLRVLSDFHTRLLDKLGSVAEFGQFVQTGGGGRFLETLTADPRTVAEPRERILRSAHVGVVTALVGVGLLIVALSFTFFAQGATAAEGSPSAASSFGVLGALCLSLGLGFLLSAVVSHRLARAIGLLNGVPASQGEERR